MSSKRKTNQRAEEDDDDDDEHRQPMVPSDSPGITPIRIDQTYERSTMHWSPARGDPVVSIVDSVVPELELCRIPMAFLESCGDNSWRYIYTVLRCCVENGEGGMLIDDLGRECAEESLQVPAPGEYQFRNAGEWFGLARPIIAFPSYHSQTST
jgi:hypothetical protein